MIFLHDFVLCFYFFLVNSSFLNYISSKSFSLFDYSSALFFLRLSVLGPILAVFPSFTSCLSKNFHFFFHFAYLSFVFVLSLIIIIFHNFLLLSIFICMLFISFSSIRFSCLILSLSLWWYLFLYRNPADFFLFL